MSDNAALDRGVKYGQCGWCGNSGVMYIIYSDGRKGTTEPCWHCKGTGTDKFETPEEKALTAQEEAQRPPPAKMPWWMRWCP